MKPDIDGEEVYEEKTGSTVKDVRDLDLEEIKEILERGEKDGRC
jgi:hypothetical protein